MANNASAEMLDKLSAMYMQWLDEQELPRMSADELLVEEFLTKEQRQWVSFFSLLWEQTELIEPKRNVV